MAAAIVLAQSSSGTGQVLLWVAVLIGAVIAASVIVLILRRKLLSPDTAAEDTGSIMESLRAMRDRGEISQDEYDRTRQAMIARAAGKPLTRPTPAPTTTPEEHRARPGYDLTGEPLPGTTPESTQRPDKNSPPHPGHPPA